MLSRRLVTMEQTSDVWFKTGDKGGSDDKIRCCPRNVCVVKLRWPDWVMTFCSVYCASQVQ